MSVRNLTCIICPMGCSMKVTLENGAVTSVEGNTCPRGKAYAESECTNPMRTITTTMKCDNGDVIPVKTKDTIPKDKMFECMHIVNRNIVHLPVSVGDVIIDDVFGTSIVAAKNML